jgi:serine protease Do
MKLNRFYAGVSSVALVLAAAIATVHFVAHAKDAAPAVRVDRAPINRDARSGNSYSPVVKKVSPSVVNISTAHFIKERPQQNPFMNDPVFRQFFGGQIPGGDGRERTRRENSLGSGVIVTADGYILTANHVVADADEVKVTISGNKKEFTARIVGKDRATDIAVLKISADNLPAVTLGDSEQLEVGDIVLAIGNPFGLNQTVTSGIISALGRSGLPGFNQVQDFIQTDAAINPGNSGGALIDAQGRLIGINTAIVSTSGGNNGIGLAVPVNLARNVMDRLISGGKFTRGYIGVYLQDMDAGLVRQFNLPDDNGALIGDVMPNSPAAKAGLKSGDVIVAVNGKEISGADNLKLTISQLLPGSPAALKYFRNGTARNVNVTLGENPESESADSSPDNSATAKSDALDGVFVQDLDAQFRRQLQVPADVSGAVVTDVDRASNSYDAGLRTGDVIVEVNHQAVASAADTVKLCKSAKGEEIRVKIWRRMGDFGGTRFISVDNTKRAK